MAEVSVFSLAAGNTKQEITLDVIQSKIKTLCKKVNQLRNDSVLILQALHDNITDAQSKDVIFKVINDCWSMESDWFDCLSNASKIIHNAKNNIPGQMRISL